MTHGSPNGVSVPVRKGQRPPRRIGRVLRGTGIALAGLVVAAVVTLAVLVYAVPYPAWRLDPGRGGPLVILDRSGALLRSVPAQGGRPGREAWVPLDRVPTAAVAVLLASEDDRFFQHPGVDVWAIGRATWLNLRAGRTGYGGSTLTMQLVRMVHHPSASRTLGRKLEEAVLALRLERQLGKRAILEQYLNRAFFGNGAYGIEAAAQLYFGKPAASLSVGEATLLTVVPRAPSAYDPLTHLERALTRREHVLELLCRKGLLDAGEAERARAQRLEPTRHEVPFRAPHFVDWVLAELPPEVRRGGGLVTTTLDLDLQEQLERRVAEHVAAAVRQGLQQAGLVVLDTQTGAVLAMVGSVDFQAGEGGQLNITTWRRHPGSALKPFVYALAIEAGASPATIALDAADVPSAYEVDRLTQPERGPIRYREALAGSYNLAAIHVLEKVGLERLLETLNKAGLALGGAPADYGLRLALGAGRVRLVDLAAAYGFLGREGKVTAPVGVTSVKLGDDTRFRPTPPAPRRLFSPTTAWLVADILSDPEARRPAFGPELPLDDLPFPVAAKTGTARGFADTVAVGVTREVTVAAWGGNFDGTPTQGLLAMRSAAPLLRAGLLAAARGRRLTLSPPPPGIVSAEVCPLSGLLPGDACPHRKLERFRSGTVPTARCSWHRHNGHQVVVEYPPELAGWLARH